MSIPYLYPLPLPPNPFVNITSPLKARKTKGADHSCVALGTIQHSHLHSVPSLQGKKHAQNR